MRRCALLLVAALGVTACAEETPTGVGGGLLPADAIRTFEVTLQPTQWLVSDTSFGLYSEPAEVDFAIIANAWDGALDSRMLLRYTLPISISVIDTLGTFRIDSMPRFVAGELKLVVDTVRTARENARLGLFRSTEDWHDFSATWTLRVDTGGVRVPWTQPGGSLGSLITEVDYLIESDTVTLPVDSATLAVWADTTQRRGVVVTMQTEGARLRTSLPLLVVQARSAARPDSLVTITLSPDRSTFIFRPEPGDSASLPRVGGTPTWRTFLRLRDRLDTVTVACPGVTGCRVKLADAQINRAAMQLQPVPTLRGLAPEGDLFVGVYLVLPTAGVPVPRSLLTNQLGGSRAIPPSSFMAGTAPVAEVDITELLLTAAAAPTDTVAFRPSHFALLPAGVRTFGFGTFAELPALRIIISIARELQLP